MSWQSQVIAILAASLVRPFALAAAAWLILRILRVRHPASRHAVWTAVLVGMLLLPVLSVIAPHWNLPVRLHKHDVSAPALAVEQSDIALPTESASRPSDGKSADRSDLVLWCYLAGLFAMALYRALGLALMWRVVSRSRPVRAGRLRESGDVLAPVAMGLLHPSVILPAGWRTWDPNTRRAVLLHEFEHLRRHDAWVSSLARLVKCLLWFHPLAWWVSRKISGLAELACDAAVLERMRDPAGYSRILLQFADRVNGAGHRVALPGLAMAAGSGMSRRIDQLFELSAGAPRKLARPGLLLALTGVPVMCLAATAGLGEPVPPPPGPAAPSVPAESTSTVTRESDYVTGTGNVVASNTVRIRPRVDGQLMSVSFQEGELVQAGQVLATIDSSPYKIQLEQAKSQLVQDEALLQNASLNLDRYRKLVAQNAIPPEQLIEPTATLEQLRGKVKAAQARLESAELELSYTQVIAPITGVAGLRLVDPGNLVHAADATGIVIITQLQPIAVLFDISQESLPAVRARLKANASPAVEAWNRDYTVKIATGRLIAVDNQIDPATATVKLKAVFDNKDGAMIPGQFVNVRLF